MVERFKSAGYTESWKEWVLTFKCKGEYGKKKQRNKQYLLINHSLKSSYFSTKKSFKLKLCCTFKKVSCLWKLETIKWMLNGD